MADSYNSNVERMLSKMETSFQNCFSQINAQLAEVNDRQEQFDKKLGKTREFQRKGNKYQHQFNTSLYDVIEDAKIAVEKKKFGKALEKLTKCMTMVSNRQKLILLADETSWEVVQEYMGCSVADDSDDETKIRRAIAAVERKKKANTTRDSKKRNRWVPYNQRGHGNKQNNDSFRSYGNNRSPPRGGYQQYQSNSDYKSRSGTCFACGGYGHWASDCSSRKKQSYDNKRN